MINIQLSDDKKKLESILIENFRSRTLVGDLLWNLNSSVNILTGFNGSGKTFILDKINKFLTTNLTKLPYSSYKTKWKYFEFDRRCMNVVENITATKIQEFNNILSTIFSHYLNPITFIDIMSGKIQLTRGERRLCNILFNILVTKELDLIIIDGIDFGLHENIQGLFIDIILSIKPDIQIICTTHSSHIVDTYTSTSIENLVTPIE